MGMEKNSVAQLIDTAEQRCRRVLDTVDGAFVGLGGNADPADLVERLEQAFQAAWVPLGLATSQLEEFEALVYRDQADPRSAELQASGRLDELRAAVDSATSHRDIQRMVLGVAVANQMTHHHERLHDDTSAARWRATAASRTAAHRRARDERKKQMQRRARAAA